MLKIEERFLGFLKKHYLVLGFIAILVLALVVRFAARGFVSEDYELCLSKWFEQMRLGGGMKALANYPGDYNAPYMTIMAIMTYLPFNPLYMIKGVSIVFDVILALACTLLVRELAKNQRTERRNFLSLLTFGATLFMPTVIMNSSFWGQCDSIYASFIIFAIYFLLKEKFIPSFLMLGVAFAFKFQTIFVLPFFVIMYLVRRKFSILHFLIIPAVDFVMCLPAILCGWPVRNVFQVYLHQAESYNYKLAFNFPSIYNIANGDINIMVKVGIVAVLVMCLFVLVFCIYKKPKWNAEKILATLLVIMMLVAFVMPKMHERYMYVCEILGVIYCLVYRKNWVLAGLLILAPLITYSYYLFGVDYSPIVLTIGVGIAGSYVCYKLLSTIATPTMEKNE